MSAPFDRPLKVLLLDDSPMDAELSLHELARADLGVQGEIVTTREEFTSRIWSTEYDVILADYRMPSWTGLDALAELQATGRDTPFILVSGTLGDESAVECIKRGVTDYVLKENLVRLPVVIRRAIEDVRVRRERNRAEQRFAQMADTIDEVFFVVDSQFRETVYVNRAYETVFGRSCASLYENPRSFLEPVHPDDLDELLKYIGLVQHGQPVGKFTFRVVRPTGEVRWLLSHAKPVQNEHGEVYRLTGVALDVTETHQLEEQFRQAQKLEAVGRLAGGVAHDFNNLLTIITTYTALLLGDLPTDDPRREDLTEIAKAAEGATGLTRQLLAFSRQEVIAPRAVVLQEVVGAAGKMLQRLIGEDVHLVTVLDPELAVAKIDPGQLEQVIMNLAVNARDAMRQGGRLTIEVRTVDLDSEYTSAHWPAQPGRYAMLAVTDTGAGMDRTTQARMFEPFFTTKPVGKGTGLGLSTVYGIVKQSGGFIWVYSEVGRGTTFKIYLPIAGTPDARELETEPEMLDGTETILLVEDDAAVRGAVRESLERHGYTVLEAASGGAALAIARNQSTHIALLLTDVVMPTVNGRLVAEEINGLRPDIRILYMSGYTDDAVVRHGVLAEGVAYLQKPFTPTALAKKVRQTLRPES